MLRPVRPGRARTDTAAFNEFFTDMLGAVGPFKEASRWSLPGASDAKVIDMLHGAVRQIDTDPDEPVILQRKTAVTGI